MSLFPDIKTLLIADRHQKINKDSTIDAELIYLYVQEAKENEKKGLKKN